MLDPVTLPKQGKDHIPQNIDRWTLQDHFDRHGMIDPFTNNEMKWKKIKTNDALREAILEWKKDNEELYEEYKLKKTKCSSNGASTSAAASAFRPAPELPPLPGYVPDPVIRPPRATSRLARSSAPPPPPPPPRSTSQAGRRQNSRQQPQQQEQLNAEDFDHLEADFDILLNEYVTNHEPRNTTEEQELMSVLAYIIYRQENPYYDPSRYRRLNTQFDRVRQNYERRTNRRNRNRDLELEQLFDIYQTINNRGR